VFSLLSDTTESSTPASALERSLLHRGLDTASGAGALRKNTAGSNNCRHTNQTKEVIVSEVFASICLLRWVKVLSVIRVISVIRS
jgi:hypothetical protein